MSIDLPFFIDEQISFILSIWSTLATKQQGEPAAPANYAVENQDEDS
jgi:hypothetical protein